MFCRPDLLQPICPWGQLHALQNTRGHQRTMIYYIIYSIIQYIRFSYKFPPTKYGVQVSRTKYIYDNFPTTLGNHMNRASASSEAPHRPQAVLSQCVPSSCLQPPVFYTTCHKSGAFTMVPRGGL